MSPSLNNNQTHAPSPFLLVNTYKEATIACYLCAFAILGSTMRCVLGQMFGGACEYPLEYVEWLQPFQNYFCITSNGRTYQKGGAIFVDLPANMIGSFLIGFLSLGSKFDDVPSASLVHILWLHPDHYFQNFHEMHLGMRTGFCGSLTTFASWNAQMVIMMDGTGTALGSQVPSSIFGYIIGLVAAFMSLKFGQSMAIWIHNFHLSKKTDKNDDLGLKRGSTYDDEMEEYDVKNARNAPEVSSDSVASQVEEGSRDEEKNNMAHFCSRVLRLIISLTPFILASGLLAVCMSKDHIRARNGQSCGFYRSLWLSALFAPLGVFLRWKLSILNKRAWRGWLPHGTLIANMVGSMVSISAVALASNYSSTDHSMWVTSIIFAIKTGFAGSLSTVSTFVDEVDKLNVNYPRHAKAYIYSFGSLLGACLFSLVIYCPAVRFHQEP